MTETSLEAPVTPSGRLGPTFYRRAGAFCAMLAVAMIYRADHLTDWDSWDYCAQAICKHSSDLLLGRWWFIALMRESYLLGQAVFGLDQHNGYLIMQATSCLVMASALVVLMVWTHRLTRSAAAETLLAVLIVSGPTIGIYASAVMTESLTVLMLGAAFLTWDMAVAKDARRRGIWALLAGLFFGVAVDIREPASLLCFWPIISCLVDAPPRRWGLLGLAMLGTVLTLGTGIVAAWAWYPWNDSKYFTFEIPRLFKVTLAGGYFENMISWTRAMAEERKLHPVSLIDNAVFLAQFSLAAAPVAAFLAIPAAIWAAMRNRRLMWIMVACIPYTVSLLSNHDLSVNVRFPIPLMWLLAPVVSAMLVDLLVNRAGSYRWRFGLTMAGLAAASAGLLLLGATNLAAYYLDYAKSEHVIYERLLDLPHDAVVIAGPGSPAAMHLNRLGERNFFVIGSGWGWPGEGLEALVLEKMREGKAVYVDLEPNDWARSVRKSSEWGQVKQLASKYAQVTDEDSHTWPLVRLLPPTATQTTQPATSTSSAE